MYNSTPFSPHLREGLSESDKNEGNLTDGGGGQGGGRGGVVTCDLLLCFFVLRIASYLKK